MTYKHRHHGQHLIIEFAGNLYDQLLAHEIEHITQPHLSGFSGNLILDMSNLEHINSSGLNLLLKLLNSYKSKDRTVIVAGANQAVSGVLTITKLNTIFGMTATLEDALKDTNSQKINH